MTVNITISETSSGYSIADSTDLGSVDPGTATSFQDLFISHDATVNPITECYLYLTRYVGTSYGGSDADADLTQILGWGATDLEGVRLSMVRDDPWAGSEFTTGWQSFKVGNGDVNTPIELDADSLVQELGSTDGEIPVGDEAHIQLKVLVPSSPGDAGVKGFTFVFSYSATS
jgi:hypothetical protein